MTSVAEIGMGLTGFGVFFLFFGMILFFDKALLAIGNVSVSPYILTTFIMKFYLNINELLPAVKPGEDNSLLLI